MAYFQYQITDSKNVAGKCRRQLSKSEMTRNSLLKFTSIINHCDEIITKHKTIANSFNKYFPKVSLNIVDKITKQSNNNFTENSSKVINNKYSLMLLPIDELET